MSALRSPSRRARALGAATAMALAAALSGCTSSSQAHAPVASPPPSTTAAAGTPQASTPPASTPPADATRAASSATVARVVDADHALQQSLGQLAAASALMQQSASYGDQRRALGAAVTGARNALAQQRTAAQSGTCSVVWSRLTTIRSDAARAHAARVQLLALTASTRSRSEQVTRDRSLVSARMAALAAALRGAGADAPPTTPQDRVTGALADVASQQRAVAAQIADAEAQAAQAVATIGGLAAKASVVTARAC